MLDCVLISRDEDFRRQVSELIRRGEGQARLMLDIPSSAEELPREALGRILGARPQVVFLDLGETSTTGARVLKALGQEAPDVAVLVAGPALEAEALLDIMRSGAAEYLPRPLGDEDTATAFNRVRRRLAPGRADAAGDLGTLVSVFSAKGGTGVSTVAVNFASQLEKLTGKSVLLLDLAPALGTAPLLLGVRPRYSYLDVIQNFHRLDDELLESFLEQTESGVSVLASPSLLSDAPQPDTAQVMALVRLCQRHFDYVVVDAGTALTEITETVLRESTERIVVSTPELPTLRNLKRVLDLVGPISSNGHSPPKIVLNQYRDGTGVSRREVEEALGQPVYSTVEWDAETVVQSVNLGQPAVLAASRSRFSKDFDRFGRRLIVDLGDEAVGEEKKGLLNVFRLTRDR